MAIPVGVTRNGSAGLMVLMPTVSSMIEMKKYATDVLGNLYEVKENKLKLEFE